MAQNQLFLTYMIQSHCKTYRVSTRSFSGQHSCDQRVSNYEDISWKPSYRFFRQQGLSLEKRISHFSRYYSYYQFPPTFRVIFPINKHLNKSLIMKQYVLIDKHGGGSFHFHFKNSGDDVLWGVVPHETWFGARDIDKGSFYRKTVDVRRVSRFGACCPSSWLIFC